MAWSGPYYYRSVWMPGIGPRRQYIGRGLPARLAAGVDAQHADRVAMDAQRARERAQRDADRDAQLDADYRAVRTHVHAGLVAAGWYSHRREWRRYTLQIGVDDMPEALTRADLENITHDELSALVDRCNRAKPKAADLDALRTVLASPIGAHMLALSGLTLASQMFDATPGSRLVTDAEIKRHRAQLGGDNAPALEQPLIDHITVCWVAMQITQQKHTNATRGQHELRMGLYWDRRLAAAQARYLRALGLLARMRSLTNVQINVATNQQVNNG